MLCIPAVVVVVVVVVVAAGITLALRLIIHP
jgi:hypothetical protein